MYKDSKLLIKTWHYFRGCCWMLTNFAIVDICLLCL